MSQSSTISAMFVFTPRFFKSRAAACRTMVRNRPSKAVSLKSSFRSRIRPRMSSFLSCSRSRWRCASVRASCQLNYHLVAAPLSRLIDSRGVEEQPTANRLEISRPRAPKVLGLVGVDFFPADRVRMSGQIWPDVLGPHADARKSVAGHSSGGKLLSPGNVRRIRGF